MDKGKHSKRYPQGSMAARNWKQLQGFMLEERRNSRQSRAHRLEALQEPCISVLDHGLMEMHVADVAKVIDLYHDKTITAAEAHNIIRRIVQRWQTV